MKWIVGALFAFCLVGCSSTDDKKDTSQQPCLEQGMFRYQGECTKPSEIPNSAMEDIFNQVADEIAKNNNISKVEALQLIKQIVDEATQK